MNTYQNPEVTDGDATQNQHSGTSDEKTPPPNQPSALSRWLQMRIKSLRGLTLEMLEQRIKYLFSIIARGLSSLIMLVVIVGSLRGFLEKKILFNDFNVPESFEIKGISGQVLKNKIMNKAISLPALYAEPSISITTIKLADGTEDTIRTRKNASDFSPTSNLLEQDVEIMGVSLNSVKGLIRSAVGITNTVIGGNLIEEDSLLTLELNINTEGLQVEVFNAPGYHEKPKKCLDELIEKAAVHILAMEQPLYVAFYYYRNGDIKNAELKLNEALKYGKGKYNNAVDKAKGHNLLGEILYAKWFQTLKEQQNSGAAKKSRELKKKQQRLWKEAKEHFQMATEINASLVSAWTNRGDILMAADLDTLRAIYNTWLTNGQPAISKDTSQYRRYKKSVQEAYHCYLKADTIARQGPEKDSASTLLESTYFKETKFYHALFHDKDTARYPRIAKLLGLLPDPTFYDHAHYYSLAAEAIQDQEYQFGTELYLQYLEHIRDHEVDYAANSILSDPVTESHPFIQIFRTIQELYRRQQIDRLLYHQTIEQLAYLDWQYELFSLDVTEIEFFTEETELYGYPEEEDTPPIWSDYSLTPDPQLIGSPMDPFTEDLWSFLITQYDGRIFLNEQGDFFTSTEDYVQEVNRFIAEELEEVYWDVLWGEYSTWATYRQQKTFGASLTYNKYLRSLKDPADGLNFSIFSEIYHEYLSSLKRDENGRPIDQYRQPIDTLAFLNNELLVLFRNKK